MGVTFFLRGHVAGDFCPPLWRFLHTLQGHFYQERSRGSPATSFEKVSVSERICLG